MSDPRKNLPSASSAEADSLCPGRFMAQEGLPDDKSEDAASGDRVHLAFRGQPVELSEFEKETVDRGKEIENQMLTSWLESETQQFEEVREERLFAHDPVTLAPICSGQADAFWMLGNRALLEDLKSLYGDIPEAPLNMQLRDLAVLIHVNYGIDEVLAFINQPRVTNKPVLVRYGFEDLKRAHAEMIARVKRSVTPGQPRVAGPKQCHHCRANASCPEAMALVRQVSRADNLKWDAITSEEKLDLYDACKAAEKIIESIQRKIKDDLKFNPEAIPGLKLAKGDERRTLAEGKSINDVFNAVAFDICPVCGNNELIKAACEKCNGSGRIQIISTEQFVSVCGVKISETETLFRKTMGLKTKEAAVEFNKRLAGVMIRKPSAPSLERE